MRDRYFKHKRTGKVVLVCDLSNEHINKFLDDARFTNAHERLRLELFIRSLGLSSKLHVNK